MIDTKSYAFFTTEGYEILGDLLDFRSMSTAQLADVARRYATGLENYTLPDDADTPAEPAPQKPAEARQSKVPEWCRTWIRQPG